MSIAITNTTILSTFTLIKAALKANATLSARFNDQNILQFEPKHKSIKFKGFPYIWVNFPSTDESKLVFDNNFTLHELEGTLILRLDRDRDENKTRDYCNAILKAIRDYESTFEASGYYDVMISSDDIDPNTVIDNKELIECVFTITFQGSVNR